MIPTALLAMNSVAGKFNLAWLVKGLNSEWTFAPPASRLGMELIRPSCWILNCNINIKHLVFNILGVAQQLTST